MDGQKSNCLILDAIFSIQAWNVRFKEEVGGIGWVVGIRYVPSPLYIVFASKPVVWLH